MWGVNVRFSIQICLSTSQHFGTYPEVISSHEIMPSCYCSSQSLPRRLPLSNSVPPIQAVIAAQRLTPQWLALQLPATFNPQQMALLAAFIQQQQFKR
jgi:hypothetical protein